MTMAKRVSLFLTLTLLLWTVAAMAADAKPAAITGFRADVLHEMGHTNSKIVDLAKAVPVDKYAWKPGEGVRSVAEVYAHIAAANDMFAGAIIGKARAGGDTEVDLGGKDKTVAELSASYDRLKAAIEGMNEADLDQHVKLFGQDFSKRELILVAEGHLHEHLGQSIAYARMNGVVPPWSK